MRRFLNSSTGVRNGSPRLWHVFPFLVYWLIPQGFHRRLRGLFRGGWWSALEPAKIIKVRLMEVHVQNSRRVRIQRSIAATRLFAQRCGGGLDPGYTKLL